MVATVTPMLKLHPYGLCREERQDAQLTRSNRGAGTDSAPRWLTQLLEERQMRHAYSMNRNSERASLVFTLARVENIPVVPAVPDNGHQSKRTPIGETERLR